MPSETLKQHHNWRENALMCTKTAVANAATCFAKMHLICCVAMPLALEHLGHEAAEKLETPAAEAIMFAFIPPVATIAGVWVGDKIEHLYNHIRNKPAHCCSRKDGKFWAKQTALGYLFYGAMHVLSRAHHDHDSHKHDAVPPSPSTTIKTSPPAALQENFRTIPYGVLQCPHPTQLHL